MTLAEFYVAHERESWNGYAVAWKAGAKSVLTGDPCRYVVRPGFQDAWKRGEAAMRAFLDAGGTIESPPPSAAPPTKARHFWRHGFGVFDPTCECDLCMHKRGAIKRKEAKVSKIDRKGRRW